MQLESGDIMLTNLTRGKLIGIWFATLAIVAAGALVLGLGVTFSTGVLLIGASVVPPAVAMLVWRGAPPITVAELLHSVNAAPGKKDAALRN